MTCLVFGTCDWCFSHQLWIDGHTLLRQTVSGFASLGSAAGFALKQKYRNTVYQLRNTAHQEIEKNFGKLTR